MRALLKKQTAHYESFDLNEAVRDCIALVNATPLLDGLSIKVEAVSERLPVRADRVQLQQVLFNLMVNAAAAMRGDPQSARSVVMRTGVEDEQTAKVSVVDSGTGIDEHNV